MKKALILLGILCAPAAFAGLKVDVEAVNGANAYLVHGGKQEALHKGMSLGAGDEVKTGSLSAVDLRFEDNTLVRVGVNSSYKVEEKNSHAASRLGVGILRILVPENTTREKKIRFQLRTAEGTVGVRGTEFVVERQKEETRVKTLRGEVLLGPADADFADLGRFVLVLKGYESVIRSGKGASPSKPAKMPLQETLNDLNEKRGPFGPLASRISGQVKARSTSPETKTSKAAPAFSLTVSGPSKSAATPAEPGGNDPLDLLASAALKCDQEALNAVLSTKKVEINSVLPKVKNSTVLHVAAASNDIDNLDQQLSFVQNLIDADPSMLFAKNDEGRTPLSSVAAETGDDHIALLLVQNALGENKNPAPARKLILEKDKQGKSAYDYAKALHNTALLKVFDEYLK